MHDLAAMIGKRIREVRNAQGISLEELSFKAGLNAAHLGQIERGLRNPTIETLERIATALDVSFYELVCSSEALPRGQSETSEIRRKIDAQLSSMTLDEQKDILRIIRIFRRHFDEENKKAD
nr:helix-turn-helix transcriptional regulator [uncultured Agathobaculum sp.]